MVCQRVLRRSEQRERGGARGLSESFEPKNNGCQTEQVGEEGGARDEPTVSGQRPTGMLVSGAKGTLFALGDANRSERLRKVRQTALRQFLKELSHGPHS